MDSQKQQVLERIKQANNILITVSANPSVDQLAACLGLTIMLNELGKHATAVFSGKIPSTIEFLQPEKTLEKNTDSLRDFIIALDKSKADKLRYKVEDKVVKIFITPYRTSISDKDLEFSQGDFNVEVVLALGVHEQKDLDQAITSHGRILHDATVVSINTTAGNNLGTINWQDAKASSLSEMITGLSENFGKKVLDNQVATSLLTGIVAETERFSNNRTTPETMKASAALMAAGANQQLVATKLQEPVTPSPAPVILAQPENAEPQPAQPPKSNDGTLQIEHELGEGEPPIPESKPETPPELESKEEKKEEEKKDDGPQIHIDDQGRLHQLGDDREFLAGPGPAEGLGGIGSLEEEERPSGAPNNSDAKFVFDPPTLGGTLTANSRPEGLERSTDPLSSRKNDQPILDHNEHSTDINPLVIVPPSHDDKSTSNDASILTSATPNTTKIPSVTLPEPMLNPTVPTGITPPLDAPMVLSSADTSSQPAPSSDHETLSEIEHSVDSPHINSPDLNSARDAVMDAIGGAGSSDTANPIAALNAQPLGGPLRQDQDMATASDPFIVPTSNASPFGNPNFNEPAPGAASPSDHPLDMPLPPTLMPSPPNMTPPTSSNSNPTAPPAVPPPMMPPFSSSGQ